ncbi:hypothetical protein E2P81_ATG04556 [Venturia nashicola]|nr:hypothetical protein E2P81_ATG04556 [Venturia nashicola]
MAPLIPDTTSAPAVVAISTMAEPKVALSMDNLDLIDATMFPQLTLPSALAKTCRQIRQEIQNVLYRNYTARLHVTAYKKRSETKNKISKRIGGSIMRTLIFGDSPTKENQGGSENPRVKNSDHGYRLKSYDIHAFLGF